MIIRYRIQDFLAWCGFIPACDRQERMYLQVQAIKKLKGRNEGSILMENEKINGIIKYKNFEIHI